ncbi:MAG: ferrochelatase [Steroidobacteraceae bacterium]|nr:ferrochelatase [Steroidobacteraceae bacterium]
MTAPTGILLANLGTPDAPTAPAVRRFLAQFLSDPRVVDLPRLLWLPILYGVILNIRPRRSARAYREIWTEAGSPLLVNTLALARKLEPRIALLLGSPAIVATGMTYGNPSIASALEDLRARGAARVAVLPLYPQYSASTTESVFDRVEEALAASGWRPGLVHVRDYYDDAGHLAAVADSLAPHRPAIDAGARLLFSFHGLPQRYVDAGDPYASQCEATARLVAERLALPAGTWSLSYQSRVGRERWLMPYTEERLRELAAAGTRRLIACCPGFAVDCLETLEEIAMRGRATFLEAGGESFEYVPALNDGAGQVESLARIAARALGARA